MFVPFAYEFFIYVCVKVVKRLVLRSGLQITLSNTDIVIGARNTNTFTVTCDVNNMTDLQYILSVAMYREKLRF